MHLLPPGFLFRLTYRCRYEGKLPRLRGAQLLGLGPEHRIEEFPEVHGTRPFAEVRMAWNEQGLAFQAEVGEQRRASEDLSECGRRTDRILLWIDTRDARQNHRATRYCHLFIIYPRGKGEEEEPRVVLGRIPRALENPLGSDPGVAPLSVQTRGRGYSVELFLPKGCLYGYDPETNSRLGFFYQILDTHSGTQTPLIDTDFPFQEDPSLWHTLELVP